MKKKKMAIKKEAGFRLKTESGRWFQFAPGAAARKNAGAGDAGIEGTGQSAFSSRSTLNAE